VEEICSEGRKYLWIGTIPICVLFQIYGIVMDMDFFRAKCRENNLRMTTQWMAVYEEGCPGRYLQ